MAATDLGNITNTSGVTRTGGPCPENAIGMTIMRFGKSLPLVELFEVFMITGFVLIAVASAAYFTFHNMADILKSEGGSPSSVNIANAAAHAQPVWIAVGFLIFVIGILFYYFHRRVIGAPS